MSNNKEYIVIIYSGATNKGANSIIANWIATGVKKSGLDVIQPIDINLATDSQKSTYKKLIQDSNGLIVGSGDYNGNIEPPLLDFFDKYLGAGFKSSFLASKVAGQFVTAGDAGTGAQPILNDLSRLMMTFGANIVTGGESKSTYHKPGSGSWHVAQGIVGIIGKDSEGKPIFTNKYLQEDAEAYGERIGNIASFFTENYRNVIMNTSQSEPESGNTIICNHNNYNNNWLIILLSSVIILLILFIVIYFFKIKNLSSFNLVNYQDL
jgi:multimeric flavodoxin WrbA